jgi:hypothetical protein
MLHLTSFIFGAVAIKGFYLRQAFYNIAFTWLMGLSILNHARMYDVTGMHINTLDRWVIRKLDTLVAHAVFIYSGWDALKLPMSFGIVVYWWCAIWTVAVYYIKSRHIYRSGVKEWHASIHIASAIGVSAMMMEKAKYLDSA